MCYGADGRLRAESVAKSRSRSSRSRAAIARIMAMRLFAASGVMAAATFTGAVLPAVPFAFSSGPLAIAASAVLIVCIGVTVSLIRPNRGLSLALAETFILLAAVAAVVVACALTFPGSAA